MADEINLKVPFISQFDPQSNENATDNCGPACVAMILNYYGENITPNSIFERTGAQKGQLITISQLQVAITSYGYTSAYKQGCNLDDIRNLLKNSTVPIALVHYENLSSRQDINYKVGHFIVIDGLRDDGVFAQDPDFYEQFRSDGDHHFYKTQDFIGAWGNCHLDGNPDSSLLVIYPKPAVVQPEVQPTVAITPNATEQSIIDQLRMERDRNWNYYQDEKGVSIKLQEQITELQREVNDNVEAKKKLLDEIASVKEDYAGLAETNKKLMQGDSADVREGIKAIEENKDLKSTVNMVKDALPDKIKKPTRFQIGKALDGLLTKMQAMEQQLKKQKVTNASQIPDKTQADTKEEPSFFKIWFGW